MKLTTNVVETQTGGVSDEGEFKIKASAKAFSILSSGLYSDKFEAIVRELSCNAYDSHVEAGNPDTPFTVHLPSVIEPYFSIRDYGVGLDHEGVMNVYTTYFESTKTESNDFTGALGLGSKSPFSYTNNFTVIACKNGIKRMYGCFINENGIPSIAKMGEDLETDEYNGVEVKFSVLKEDVHKFDDAVRRVLKWFPTIPEIRGRRVDVEQVQYKETIAPGIYIRETYDRYADKRPIALQGNVAYPLSPPMSAIPDELHFFLKTPALVIEFPIGELDIAASREELQYIKPTNDNIVKRLRRAYEALTEHVRNKIMKERTIGAQLIAATDLLKTNNIFSNAVNDVIKELDSKSKWTVYCDFYRAGFIFEREDVMKFLHRHNVSYRFFECRDPMRSRSKLQLSERAMPSRLAYYPKDATLRIFINDLGGKGAIGRVRNALIGGDTIRQGAHGTQVFLIDLQEGQTFEQAKQRYQRVFGGAELPVYRVSALPKPIINRAARTSKSGMGETKYLRLLEVESSRYSVVWRWDEASTNLADADISKDDKPIYYVRVLNKSVVFGDRTMDKWVFSRFVSAVIGAGITTEERIIAVRKSQVDQLTSKCVPLFEHTMDVLRNTPVRNIGQHWYYNTIETSTPIKHVIVAQRLRAALPKSSYLARALTVMIEGSKKAANAPINGRGLVEVADWFTRYRTSLEFEVIAKIPNLYESKGKAFWIPVLKRYPLLKHIDWYGIGRGDQTAMNSLVHYVRAVDQDRASKDSLYQATINTTNSEVA